MFWLIGFILLFLGSELNGQENEGINIGGHLRDAGSSIILDQRGDLVICGTTRSYGNGGDDMMLVKIDLEEGVQFQKTYKWTHHERAWCIEETTDGDYVVFCDFTSHASTA